MRPKPPFDRKLLAYAREMRHESTEAEAKLWWFLRNRKLAGFKFKRQVPIDGYIVDFYCHDALLVVELDGGQHNEEPGRRYDDGRTEALARKGIRIIRFWNPDVLKSTVVVLENIYDYLTNLTRWPPSP
jgi:very-short-patch-repair endonuclease